MSELSAHQLKRIRRADAADIGRMTDQERYWFPEALREILRRIEKINNEDPEAALAAGDSVLRLVRRIRDASPDLHAVTLALYASTLRSNGRTQDALAVYDSALQLEGLSKTGRGDVLMKMSVTLVYVGKIAEGLQAIDVAIGTAGDQVQTLAIRGWIRVTAGKLPDALSDCMTVLDMVIQTPRSDYSMLSAITVACNILSFETGLDVDDSVFRRMEQIIEKYRRTYTDGGSGYYKAQRPRLMLSRAEALIFMRTGRPQQAIARLLRCVRGFEEKFPDDALASALDLVCAYAQANRPREAAKALLTAQQLLKRAQFDLKPLAQNALRAAIESKSVRYGEAVELRQMLRAQ